MQTWIFWVRSTSGPRCIAIMGPATPCKHPIPTKNNHPRQSQTVGPESKNRNLVKIQDAHLHLPLSSLKTAT